MAKAHYEVLSLRGVPTPGASFRHESFPEAVSIAQKAMADWENITSDLIVWRVISNSVRSVAAVVTRTAHGGSRFVTIGLKAEESVR